MAQFIETCPFTKSNIEVNIQDDIAYLVFNANIDSKYSLNSFLLLIRITIDKLKKRNIQKIRQYLLKEEYDNVIKNSNTTFNIVEEVNDMYIIECTTDEFLLNVAKGLGIEE